MLGFSLVLYLVIDNYTKNATEQSYDNLLTAAALSIADAVQNESGGLTVEIPYASHAILAYRMNGRVFYRVSAPDGALITGYEGLAAGLSPARSQTPRFDYGDFLGARVRIVTLGRFVSGGLTDGWVTVAVAQSTEDREQFASELRRYAFGPTLAMMALAAGLIWIAIRQALRPLDDIERAIAESDVNRLQLPDFPVPWEVRHLVGAVNSLMSRLQALLMHMQDFIAESAHQLRSPLASLRTQLELALDEPDQTTARAHLAIVRRNAMLVSNLANQLLADTMIVHRGEMAQFTPVDLFELVETVTEEFAERAGAKIDLDVTSLNEAPMIEGDALMLREAINNLLDNAVKYAGAVSPIDVAMALSAESDWVVLTVADRGPGLPAHERAAALGRFFRGENAGESVGSGLGLAIVAKVVDRHGGEIELSERQGGGLKATMTFRALPTATAGL